jgi:phosphonate transport system substrate-binding protein
MTPSTYISANAKFRAKLVAKALKDGKPFHHAVIITKNDSDFKTVRDIRGRSFAFGDVQSTSSHIVPRAMLLSEGIDLKDLNYYNYLGHHSDVIEAVLSGDFDAGAVMESAAVKNQDRGLRIIKVSEEIAEFNITASADIDKQVLGELKNALLALNDSDPENKGVLKAINEHYTGFVEAEDDDYRNVRLMMTKIGL